MALPGSDPRGDTDTRRSVLLVEDDEHVSQLLAALLADRGYRTLCARTGAAAIRLARQHRPDLITLDLRLPEQDGRWVLERLKADAQTRDIPVVVISAFTQVLPAGERRKVAYVLGKPFDLDEVLDVVQATVGSPYL